MFVCGFLKQTSLAVRTVCSSPRHLTKSQDMRDGEGTIVRRKGASSPGGCGELCFPGLSLCSTDCGLKGGLWHKFESIATAFVVHDPSRLFRHARQSVVWQSSGLKSKLQKILRICRVREEEKNPLKFFTTAS